MILVITEQNNTHRLSNKAKNLKEKLTKNIFSLVFGHHYWYCQYASATRQKRTKILFSAQHRLEKTAVYYRQAETSLTSLPLLLQRHALISTIEN